MTTVLEKNMAPAGAATVKNKGATVAIMQPYFFPHLGYFQLINAVDRFILGDAVQYIYQGWINRNRILKPVVEGYCYIHVPVQKHHFQTPIQHIKIVSNNSWKEKLLRQLEHYRFTAPFYKQTIEVVQEGIKINSCSITHLNAHCLKAVAGYLDINHCIQIQSELNFDYTEVKDRVDRPIKMCQQLNGAHYINSIGGTSLYEQLRFQQNGIRLSFLKPNAIRYEQFKKFFIPGLSIIDVMMFNAPETIKAMLADYELV